MKHKYNHWIDDVDKEMWDLQQNSIKKFDFSFYSFGF